MTRAGLRAAILALVATPTGVAATEPTNTAPPPAPVVLSPGVLKGFNRIVGNARTTVFGEDSHGMLQIHQMVPQLFRELVEKKGYRVFVFEAQWGLTAGLADFLASDRTKLNTNDSYWLNGAFASQPIADMLVYIRTWNRAHPNDQIQVAGYQPEQPVTDFGALLPYVDKSLPARAQELRQGIAVCRAADTSLYKTELDFITANGKILKTNKGAFTADERKACLAGLSAIERALPASQDREARFARLHLFSLKSYYSILRQVVDMYFDKPEWTIAEGREQQHFGYHNGDAARFVIYNELKALRFPNAKVFHWMHNWHGARHASELDAIGGSGGAGIPPGTVSFGERLMKEAGKKGRNFVTLVPCDNSCKEPENSLEAAFAKVYGRNLTLISTRDKAARKGLPLGSVGTMFANHHQFGFSNVVLERQADGVFYLPRSAVVR